MEYTGERPKITDKDGYSFKINGIKVKMLKQNGKSHKVTCPNCDRPMRMMLKYPVPGAVWGCRTCQPHDRNSPVRQMETKLRDYTMDQILKMTPKKLEKITGRNDALEVIAEITASPERYLKTPHFFRPVDKLQWRTDDDRIPCAVKMAKKAIGRSHRVFRSKGHIIKVRVPSLVLKALTQFAADNAMPLDRAAGACVRWCMEHSDKVQVRPI